MLVTAFVILVFGLAIVFTWTNGFQHGSAVAASALGSHSMQRGQVILLIFVFEILGTLLGGSAVAQVIQSLSSWPEDPTLLPLLASALLAAILWNFLARRLKMPASSTHSLIGGMIGALVAGDRSFEHVQLGQCDPVHPSGVLGAVVSLFLSPMLGFLVSYLLFCSLLIMLLYASSGAKKFLTSGQWFMTAALAFGDGQNDTQKTMGLLVLALNAGGFMSGHDIPIWVRAIIGVAMGLGAFWLSEGVVKELAFKVYQLKPMHAIVSEASSAIVLIGNSIIGGPVSASQVISASIMGAGTAERKVGVHWLVIKDIILSWLVTIPGSALLAAILQTVLFQWSMGLLS
jgi:PiT family inorganic phosphate transporter